MPDFVPQSTQTWRGCQKKKNNRKARLRSVALQKGENGSKADAAAEMQG